MQILKVPIGLICSSHHSIKIHNQTGKVHSSVSAISQLRSHALGLRPCLVYIGDWKGLGRVHQHLGASIVSLRSLSLRRSILILHRYGCKSSFLICFLPIRMDLRLKTSSPCVTSALLFHPSHVPWPCHFLNSQLETSGSDLM